jgi:hypothetical protein
MVVDATHGHGDDDVGKLAAREFHDASGSAIGGRIVPPRIIAYGHVGGTIPGMSQPPGMGLARSLFARIVCSGVVSAPTAFAPGHDFLCASVVYRRAGNPSGDLCQNVWLTRPPVEIRGAQPWEVRR